jgi:hypothetical protein
MTLTGPPWPAGEEPERAAKGDHGGRPKVIDDEMLLFSLILKDQGTASP